MALEIQTLSVDLLRGTASISLRDPSNNAHVNIMVPIETPGDQPESQLKELAKAAAKQALQGAIAAL